MNSNYILIILSTVLLFGTINTAYGHGLGNVESDLLYIDNKYLKIKVETNPDVLHGDETEIGFNISTINDDTQKSISKVEYAIEIFDGQKGNAILSFDAYSPEDKLKMKIIPSQNLNFSGKQSQNGLWIGSNDAPLVVDAPLFQSGGLVQVNVTILSIDSKPISSNQTTFETLLTIGEYIPFDIEIEEKKFDFMFATYFDKITDFSYDQNKEKLTALMPFNWNKEFIQKIPFVHAEYYIPKKLDIYNNHEILMTVNDIPILGTIDRSGDKEIVVHFLIPTKKLLKLFDEISPEEYDRIVFGLESGNAREEEKSDASLEEGEKAILLSTQEDWKFHLSLTPKGKINPNTEISLNIEFHDPVTNTIIPFIKYDLDIFLNGNLIKSESGLETPDGRDIVRTTFDKTGAVIVRISNVNNFDTSGEFSFQVTMPKLPLDIVPAQVVEISSNSAIPGCEENNTCYVPFNTKIEANDLVLWNNNDSAAHTVTSGTPSDGASEVFDSQLIPSGTDFSFQFSSNGIYNYYCTLHPWMIGIVSVEIPSTIPEWIKNNAKWWSEKQITDGDFATGLEYLIKNQVISVPNSITSKSDSETTIPEWLRSNAAWWADGLLSDSEFLKGIEWMIANGIIKV